MSLLYMEARDYKTGIKGKTRIPKSREKLQLLAKHTI